MALLIDHDLNKIDTTSGELLLTGTGVRVDQPLTIEPGSALAPFVLGANAIGQLVTGLRAATADAWTTGRTITLTGDVTGVSGSWNGSGNISFATTIAAGAVDTAMIGNDQVTYAKIQNVSATSRILGRITAGAGDIEELTAANVYTILGALPDANFTGTYTGVTSITSTTFIGALTGNATTATTWATGRTITLTGDVTGVSGTFNGSANLSFATTIAANAIDTAMIANSQVTYAKIQNVSATSRFLGRISASAGVVEELTAANAWTILGALPDANFTGTYTGVTSITATTFVGALTGNASTATTWATGRTITLTGNVTGVSGTFNGSANLSFATTIAAGAIVSSMIATNAVLASHYNNRDTSNMFPDPDLRDPATWTASGGSVILGNVASDGGSSLGQVQITATAGAGADNTGLSTTIQVAPSTPYYISFKGEGNGSGSNTGRVYFITYSDVAGTVELTATPIGGAFSGVTPAYANAQVITDATAKAARIRINNVYVDGAKSTVVSEIVMRRIADADLLIGNTKSLHNLSTNGLVVRSATDTIIARSLAVSGTGLSITNADGVSGNPTVTSNATSANTVSTIVARDGSGNFAAGTITANIFGAATGNNRVKLVVWGTTTYGIGMGDNYTFGGIGNDYAMTFQMNDDNLRGFWWGDATHTNAQGAMALTTDGYLNIAGGARIGYGESDTTKASAGLQVSGTVTATTFVGALTGNASTATTWATGRTITLTGNVTGVSGTFNGSANLSFATTIATGAVATTMIADDAVTYAKIQNVSATSRFLGRITAAAGVVEELTAANAWTILGTIPNANISGAYTGITTLSMSGTLTNSANGAAISITNGTQGWITFGGSGGVGAPTFTTKSVGTKIVLYDVIDGSNVDYSIGIESNTIWFATKSTSSLFKFYGGTTLALTMTGTGYLQGVNGAAATPTYSFAGDPNTGMYSGGTDILAFSTAGTVSMTLDASGNTNIIGALGVASGSPSANNTLTVSKSYTTNTQRIGIANTVTLSNEVLSANRNQYGILTDVIVTQTDASFALTVYGSYSRVITASANDVASAFTSAFGGFSNVLHRSTGTVANLWGHYIQTDLTRASADATDLRGLSIKVNGDLGTATNAYMIYAWTENDGSTITNLYGFYNRLDRDGGTVTNAIAQYNSFEGTFAGNKIGVVNNGAAALDFGVIGTSSIIIGRVDATLATITPHLTIASTGVATFSNGIAVNDTVQFQSATGNKLLLFGNTYGIGIESNNLTSWSASAFRWRSGGTSVSTGTERMTLSSAGLLTVASLTTSGVITSTAAGGTDNYYLNGATSNWIRWNANGAAGPAFTTRSAGTKLILYDAVAAAAVDIAIGVASTSKMWLSVPQRINGAGFDWWAGTSVIASLTYNSTSGLDTFSVDCVNVDKLLTTDIEATKTIIGGSGDIVLATFTNNALNVGSFTAAGRHIAISYSDIQGRENGAAAAIGINTLGGNIVLGFTGNNIEVNGELNLKSYDLKFFGRRLNTFTLRIQNTGGTLQHRIGRIGDSSEGNQNYPSVAGATTTLTNTPTGTDASTGFNAGGKISTALGNAFIFHTSDNNISSDNAIDGLGWANFADCSGLASTIRTLLCDIRYQARNVNGVTIYRPELRVKAIDGGGSSTPFNLNTTNIPSGASIEFDIFFTSV